VDATSIGTIWDKRERWQVLGAIDHHTLKHEQQEGQHSTSCQKVESAVSLVHDEAITVNHFDSTFVCSPCEFRMTASHGQMLPVESDFWKVHSSISVPAGQDDTSSFVLNDKSAFSPVNMLIPNAIQKNETPTSTSNEMVFKSDILHKQA
jgi:hypothetical protein